MKDLSHDFKESILSQEVTDLAKDYSEIALDSILTDGIIKDIPIIGSIANLFKLGQSIRDRHLIKKIIKFLNRLSDIPVEEKEKFIKRLNDEDKNGELFEKILIVLDRLDETIKAEMVGNLFRMYVMGVISKHLFLRGSSIVDRGVISDLVKLCLSHSRVYYGDTASDEMNQLVDREVGLHQFEQNLLSLGLMEQNIDQVPSKILAANGMDGTEPAITMKINSIGETLATYILYDPDDQYFKEYIQIIKEAKSN
jgi:hypothetical protein